MAELYSSSSGSYQNYLTQRQADEIKTQIKEQTNKEMFITKKYVNIQ